MILKNIIAEIKAPIIREVREDQFVNLRRLNDKSIIVEAGACVGKTIESLRNYEQTKNCKIFAIECNKEHIRTLREKKFHNVVICERAIVGQNSDKSVIFYQHLGLPRWGNIIRPRGRTHPRFTGIQEYKVKALRINDIFSFLGIDEIDFFKIDIEGSEKEVIGTMSEETASKIKQIAIEFHFPLENGTRERLEKRLKSFGFKIIINIKHEVLFER